MKNLLILFTLIFFSLNSYSQYPVSRSGVSIVDGGVAPWTSGGTAYDVNDVVYVNDKIYVANTLHASGAAFNDDIANWTQLSGGGSYKWVTGDNYNLEDIVFDELTGKLYYCSTVHTAGATFLGDIANWTELSDGLDRLSSSTDNALPRFDGVTGNLIQDSGVLVDDLNNMSTDGDITVLSGLGGEVELGSTLNTAVADILSLQTDKIDKIVSTDNAITRYTGIAGDVQDSLVTIADNGDINTPEDLVIKGNLSVFQGILKFTSSGLAQPTTLTTNVGVNTTFDIGAVLGQVVDPAAGTYTIVNYVGATGVTPIAPTSGISYILVNSAGTLVQQTARPSAQERRENVIIGRVITDASSQVTQTIVNPVVTENIASTVWDLFDYLGVFNESGNSIRANGTNLNINKTIGKIFDAGANYATDRSDPHRVSIDACTACSFFYNLKENINSTPSTAIDPTKYGNAGVLTTISGSNNRSTNQRVYLFPSGNLVIQYGQNVYGNLAEAAAEAAKADFEPNPITAGGVLISIISVRKGATDLSLATDAIFSVPTQFGTAISGGGVSTPLQGAYDVSDDGAITLDSTRTSVEIRDASSPLVTPLFEIMSNDDLTTYFSVSSSAIVANKPINANDGLVVTSTTKGATPCPVMTEAQRDLIASPVAGQCIYNSDKKTQNIYEGTKWIALGGGGVGGINYIENYSLDDELTGYVAYADAAGENVVDGAGGSPTVTCTRNTTTPLRGLGDLKITVDAANRQGEGCSYDFTVDQADLEDVVTINFDMNTSDANYADGNLRMAIYNVTDTSLIRLNGSCEDVKGGHKSYSCSFQTVASSSSYRLIWHVSSTNALGYSLYFDQISVGPTNTGGGGSGGEIYSQYTSNSGATVTTGSVVKYEDVTDASGSDYNTSTGIFTVPKTGKYLVTASVRPSAAANTILSAQLDGSTFITGQSQTSDTSTVNIAYAVYATKDSEITIVNGSGSNLTLNSSTTYNTLTITYLGTSDEEHASSGSGQEVAIFAEGGSGAALTANTENGDWTLVSETQAGLWTQTGPNGKDTFNVPETGYYRISGKSNPNATSYLKTYIDGVEQDKRIGYNGGTSVINFSSAYFFTKGQAINFRYSATNTPATSAANHYLEIIKISSAGGGSQDKTPTVAARYTSNNGQSLATSGANFIYEDLDYDTHNSYDPITGVYTAPLTGYYQVNARFASGTASSDIGLYIEVNTVKKAFTRNRENSVGNMIQISETVYLVKGDELEITRYFTVAGSASTTSEQNTFSITRIK